MRTPILLILYFAAAFSFAEKTNLKILEESTPFSGSVLFSPNDGKAHPGILVLHGSEGGSIPYYYLEAQQLAQEGFAALAFCWYHCAKDPMLTPLSTLENVELTKTLEALEWLKNSPRVGGMKVGIFGVSRGAEQALLLGWQSAIHPGSIVPATIAVHAPSDFVVSGFNWNWYDKRCYICREDENSCVDALSSPALHPKKFKWNPACGEKPKPYSQTDAWLWKGQPLAQEARIEIEQYPGPLFITHGKEDELWSYQRTLRIQQSLIAAGKSPEVHLFEGEKHIFSLQSEAVRKSLLVNFFQRTLAHS